MDGKDKGWRRCVGRGERIICAAFFFPLGADKAGTMAKSTTSGNGVISGGKIAVGFYSLRTIWLRAAGQTRGGRSTAKVPNHPPIIRH